ncbi:hypothetical protein [Pleionea sp. CnH1-48]|uniref:hypothetical protein n=1 Tax=Pleionea sp. CnH1-48 TaxID=2954494 RepID=UPI00209801B0|nr:hypothetical protein [Pleionea sp. CnH1-48]MCO7226645.1 hypothetical protein [Pleionea sp. CnH1-48]
MNNNSQKQPVKVAIRELSFEEIEFISGGKIENRDDSVPHGLGCACKACRPPHIISDK